MIEARTIITILLGIVTAILLTLLFVVELPENNKEIAAIITGNFMGAFITSITFWFGTSKSSSDKNKMIKN